MKYRRAIQYLSLGVAMVMASIAGTELPSSASGGVWRVVPGARMGDVKLGMKIADAEGILGQAYSFYETPSGTKVRYSRLKDGNPNFTIKVFYRHGRVVQVSCDAPKAVTTSGISV